MRRKKLLTAVVASAIIAAQVVMPAMAADGGSLDVGVTTKTGVIRVQVPTAMSVAVDQFMMNDTGTQIYSSEFEMINKSEVDIKVNVASTVDVASTTKLVSTKAGAEASTKDGEVWMAVAAQSDSGDYDDPKTDADTETLDALTEANANVTTFVQDATDATKGAANQTFYLGKGNTITYNLLNAGEDASAITDYVQFYELTAKAAADQDALDALIAAGDVYVAAGVAADAQSLTLVEKGGTHTHASTEVYYSVADETTAKDALNSSKLYVYGGGAAASTGGTAAFRYIGILSPEKDDWSNEDITDVHIKYDFVGVTATKFAEVASDVTYGLYYEEAITVTTTGLITIQKSVADKYESLSCNVDGTDYPLVEPTDGAWTWDDEASEYAFQFNSAWMDFMKGETVSVKVTMTDGTTATASVTFPN